MKRILAGAGLIAALATAELVGAAITGSLALVADSIHHLSDGGAAVIVVTFGALAHASSKREKFNALGAMVSYALLLMVCGWLLWSGFSRLLGSAPEIWTGPMMLFGILAFVVLVVAWNVLPSEHAHGNHDPNIGAFHLHVLTDILTSVGVLLGAVVMHFTGWFFVDALISIAIAPFIGQLAFRKLRDAVYAYADAY